MIRRPCPFCGVVPIVLPDKEDLAFCSNDKCVISFKCMMDDQWNNRPSEDKLKGAIQKMLNGIDFALDEAFSRKTVSARLRECRSEAIKFLVAKTK